MELPQQIKNEIWDYCRLNNVTNIDEFTMKLVKQGFTVEKFGASPAVAEKIVEKIVEVEKVVEVIVEKEVYITDDLETKKMVDEINKLQKESTTNNGVQSKLKEQISKLTEQLKTVNKELEKEKNKNKTDIYGE